jgi:hypothetical protein
LVLLLIGDADWLDVVVFELVNVWDGLDEWLGVLEFVDVLLPDADTLEDLVKRVLAVSNGVLVNIFEFVEVSLDAGVSDKEDDDDIEGLDEAELDSRLVVEGNALGETLSDADTLAKVVTDWTLVWDTVFDIVLLAVFVMEGKSLEVYVVVTVCVTPVGKAVILGVDVSGFDCVTEWEFVPVEHRELRWDGLADCDLLIFPLGVWVFESLVVSVCRGLSETVVEEDSDLLFLLDGVYDTDALVVFELLVELDTDRVLILLLEALGLNVEEGVAVSAGELVELIVFWGLRPVVIVSEYSGDPVLVIIPDALTLRVIARLNDNLELADKEDDALGVRVCVVEPDIDLVISGVLVSLIDPVLNGDDVDVLDDDMDLVNVVDAEFVLVAWTECVVVLVDLAVPLVVTLPVDVLELDTLRDPVGDDVVVLEADVDWVPLLETFPVCEALVVFV